MAVIQKRYARRSLFKAIGAAAGAVVAAKIGLRDHGFAALSPDAASVQPVAAFDRAIPGSDLTASVIMHEGVNDVAYEAIPFPCHAEPVTNFDSTGFYKEYIPVMRDPPFVGFTVDGEMATEAQEAMLRALGELMRGHVQALPSGARVMEFGPFEAGSDHSIRIDGTVRHLREIT